MFDIMQIARELEKLDYKIEGGNIGYKSNFKFIKVDDSHTIEISNIRNLYFDIGSDSFDVGPYYLFLNLKNAWPTIRKQIKDWVKICEEKN